MEIDGQKVPDFLDIYINQKMHGLQDFRVTCRMDTFEEPDDFIINKSKKYIGSVITIQIDAIQPGGDGSVPGLFFKGIIDSVRAVKSDLSNEDTIVLHGYSPEFILSNHRGCRTFENSTLKQIVSEVLRPCPTDILSAKISPVYSDQIPYCVQYRENSLEFLQRLAERYGEWMYYTGKDLIFGQASGNTEELVLGLDLTTLDFSLNLKAPGFKYVTYDYMNANNVQTATDKSTGKNQLNDVGKYAYDQSVGVFSSNVVENYPHLNVASNSYTNAQKKAVEIEASGIALGMAGIEATGENLNLVPGVKIKVSALKIESGGKMDYGEYLITSIEHRCDNLLNYENHFTAVPSEATVPDYANPEAIPHSEPQSAIVKDNKDPEKMGRVRVNFFWQESNQMSPWIRIVNPYSANDRGFYFIPEIEDEVMVGFEGGDAERPFIMGSLYHGKNKPLSTWPNGDNSFKGIFTKSKLKIEFDEKKKQTTIETPGGNKAVLSDDDKSIILHDQNQNKVEMTTNGISLESMKDIKITSKSKVTIDGTAGVEITSTADAKITGLNVNLNANVGFKAQGMATAEISAAGQTTVKGAMVMIN
jgi:Rhs element Vgr protein